MFIFDIRPQHRIDLTTAIVHRKEGREESYNLIIWLSGGRFPSSFLSLTVAQQFLVNNFNLNFFFPAIFVLLFEMVNTKTPVSGTREIICLHSKSTLSLVEWLLCLIVFIHTDLVGKAKLRRMFFTQPKVH